MLPYASVNEARTDWRTLLLALLTPLVSTAPANSSLEDAAVLLNDGMWSVVGAPSGSTAVVFKSEQTPLIFDPMSTLLYGFASCTGISLLYIDALRTFGIPARLVGTPAWNGNVDEGNHNWVEVCACVRACPPAYPPRALTPATAARPQVFLGDDAPAGSGGWAFIEGSPAGPGEKFGVPCDKWFCNKAHFGAGATKVFATAYDRGGATGANSTCAVTYPMAWDLANDGVCGVDRSAHYADLCNACG